jgi:oxygen-independent coproporphyrinogen-3 oxidase
MEYGVYVHIPWCRVHCPYCAFNVSTRRDPPHRAYTDAILREWALRRPLFPGRPTSVYFGGGTPSLCPPDEIARIVTGIDAAPGAEISLEANPGTLVAPLAAFRDAGVTRLSLGVQTFDPGLARRLGRGHSSDDARALVAEAQGSGFASVSFDLLFAGPRQTRAGFAADLAVTATLAPDHVSLYGLTIEAGTAFARLGRSPADEDLWRAMYDDAVDALGQAGLARYEVSNFARAGHRSRHNEHYWRARRWAGLGAGAHAWWPDGTRVVNVAAPEAYVAAADPIATQERPPPEALAFELVWSTVRHVDGLDRDPLVATTGLDVTIDPALVNAGLVTEAGRHVRLTLAGFPLADGIAARLCERLVAVPPPHPRIGAPGPSPAEGNIGYCRGPASGDP